MTTEHEVVVEVGGHEIAGWETYSIESDIHTPADGFTLALGEYVREASKLCAPDAPIQVYVDDTPVLNGRIDARTYQLGRDGAFLAISGRDKGGRLVDESSPLFTYAGMTLKGLTQKLVGDWFPEVVLRMPKDIDLSAIHAGRQSSKKVSPGESRWHVLEYFLQDEHLLAWSSATGRQFYVGQPNQVQPAAWSFFAAGDDSKRRDETNVLSVDLEESVAERYSRIVVSGTGKGNSSNYGAAVTQRRAIVQNGEGPDGTGKDFSARKTLFVADGDVRDLAGAKARAIREMLVRDATGKRLTITVPGHGQDGAIYAIETVASVEIEDIGLRKDYFVTGVRLTGGRGGQTTTLTMVPRGTVLSS